VIQHVKHHSHVITHQGVSFGVADGVGGWASSGVDPSLFSQALMYHSHRYAKAGWPGEPEIDTTQDYEDREAVEGWELHPKECLKLAYQATLRERFVVAGMSRTLCDPENQYILIHIHVKVPVLHVSSTSTRPPDFYAPQSRLP
jgi:hypothetical protein